MDEKVISLFKVKVQLRIHELFGIISGYRVSFSRRGPKRADKILEEINNSLKDFQKLIKKDQYLNALDILIYIKEQLEILKNKYGIDIREAKSFVLLLERDWANLRKLFGKYPKSEWLDEFLKQ